jgi:hypothetical protein
MFSPVTHLKPILTGKISENSYRSGNLEGLGVFAVIRRSWGFERTNGTHTSSPKLTTIIVSSRLARSAMRFVRRATPASANKTVVATALL